MSDLERCYRLLGLKPGASWEEINQAYKDLVLVWHPDRVANDEPAKVAEAQEKMKELNHARDQLRAHRAKVQARTTQTGNQSRRHYYQPYPRPHYHYQPAKPATPGQHHAQPKERSPQPPQNGQSQHGQSQHGTAHSGQSQTGYAGDRTQARASDRAQTGNSPQAADSASTSHASAQTERSSNSSFDANRSNAYRPSQQPHYSAPPNYSTYQAYYRAASASAHTHSTYYQPNAQTPPRSQPAEPPSPPKSPFPDLSGVDLSGANLSEKDLSNRNLSNANLSNADLSDTFLHKVNLSGANLERANLFRANLLQANLRQANLRGANLIGADLSGADLTNADLTDAKIGSGDRVMVKLTGAILTGVTLPDGRVHG